MKYNILRSHNMQNYNHKEAFNRTFLDFQKLENDY